ncbi:hypothetical protein AOQ84DRAFT_299935 [Glonium stellatum]|uniref:Uncharacterized protein n=1 Tax=Glonium stellatum TaxID=574774 RepID=A0A8E2JPL6_9PEZI|nr:hypothetical protein AOQ84DRAFT_299935 [Glonium stellatum]
MKFIATVNTLLLSMSTAVYALPTASSLPEGWQPISRDEILRRMETSTTASSPLEKRTPGGIYICTGANYSGTCGYAVQPFNTCIELTSPWYHNIGSFGPDQGALCRLTISAETCTAQGDAFVQYPGTPDLRNYNGVDIGDSITSFLCQECTACT